MRAFIFAVVLVSVSACGGDPEGATDQLGSVGLPDTNDCAGFAGWSVRPGHALLITGDFESRAISGGVCDASAGAITRQTCATLSNTNPVGGADISIGLREVTGKSFTVAPGAGVWTCVNGVPTKN